MALSGKEQLWLSRLTMLCQMLAQETRRDRLLRRILDYAVELTEAERGFLVLVHRQPGQSSYHLEVVECFGFDKDLIASPQGEVSRTVVAKVLKTKKSVVTTRKEDESLLDASSIQLRKTLSIVSVPLWKRGEIQGVLYLDHKKHTQFSEADLPILETFADQAHVALESVEAGTHRSSHIHSEMHENGFGAIVGKSPAMIELYRLIERFSRSWDHVLILGETGTGKELVARELHKRGRHCDAPFLSENTAALTETLIESELFGHVAGAFTGADSDHEGLFRGAKNGTLFLDEIGELDLRAQAKLLRVLQERVLRPVGGAQELPVDCRVIGATHRVLSKEVQEGRFREDLYYRLDVLRLTVPPLRERSEDIPLLVDHICSNLGVTLTFANRTMDLLKAWSWPGNVRELENEIRRLSLDGSGRVPAKRLSPKILGPTANKVSSNPGQIKDIERVMIEQALEAANGNKAKAARALGIPRTNLYRLIDEYGL
ncbi:MAG: sigma-54-dependent Fis family transcriptional regulator [Planctomycetota bacterium]|nr:sigma-54-dependent Fis family transcriptional regulator [Planctomycetota bacterium]